MRFVILPCLQGDTYIAYLLTLCKSPQIVWYATILGLHGGDEQRGRSGEAAEAGQGKMEAA